MMTWKAFARKLFELEDSDPIYMSLGRADIPVYQKKRFMAAWVTFYNPGVAAKASELSSDKYWPYIYKIFPTAKRGSERRHFRGAQGHDALDSWQKMFPLPSKMVDYMEGKNYFEVKKNAETVLRIGPYFVFKFADVQERVFRKPCYFPPEAAAHSPDVPQQGAKLIFPDKTVLQAYNTIADYMNDEGMKSPPWYDRPMNMQEAETVCCVMKQYLHGKWAPYTRTAKAVKSLLATPSDTAEGMLSEICQRVGTKRKNIGAWADDKLLQLKK